MHTVIPRTTIKKLTLKIQLKNSTGNKIVHQKTPVKQKKNNGEMMEQEDMTHRKQIAKWQV